MAIAVNSKAQLWIDTSGYNAASKITDFFEDSHVAIADVTTTGAL